MKNIKIIILFVLVLFLIVSIVGLIFMISKNTILNIKLFDFNDYQDYIDRFPSEESIGLISDANDLLKKIESFWTRKYGKSVKNQNPYQLFYDEKNDVWLVRGTLRNNSDGGVANILVDNNTGKILASWHDKKFTRSPLQMHSPPGMIFQKNS